MSLNKDYLPKSHDKFYLWQNTFCRRITKKAHNFKIDEEKLKPLIEAKGEYETVYHTTSNAQGSNFANRVERNEQTANYREVIRSFVNENIRYNSNVSDSDLKYLELTIAEGVPAQASISTKRPILFIHSPESCKHILHISDEGKVGKGGVPKGIKTCEIWYKIGNKEPADDSELSYAGSSSKSTFLVTFDRSQRGKKVYYSARWINARGEYFPWGECKSTIIF